MSETGNATQALRLDLAYRHGFGDLSPYFAGLMEGRAMARRCSACSLTWFPPRPVCPHCRAETEWHEIAPSGRIVASTRTTTRLPFTDRTESILFVLVAMDAADNAIFGRLLDADEASAGDAVRLVVPRGGLGHPAQAVQFVLAVASQ